MHRRQYLHVCTLIKMSHQDDELHPKFCFPRKEKKSMKERTCTYLIVPRASVENVLAVAPRQVHKLRWSTETKTDNAMNQNQWSRMKMFYKHFFPEQVRGIHSIRIKSYNTRKLARFLGHFLRLKTVSHFPRVEISRKQECSVVDDGLNYELLS